MRHLYLVVISALMAAHANSLSGKIDLTSNDLPSPVSTDDLGPTGNKAEILGHVL